MLQWPRKTPADFLDYTMNWTHELAEGEEIAQSEWSLLDSTGVAPELVKSNESNTPTTATVWLSNGVAGTRYFLTNKITTTASRIIEHSVWVRVYERN